MVYKVMKALHNQYVHSSFTEMLFLNTYQEKQNIDENYVCCTETIIVKTRIHRDKCISLYTEL